MGEKMGRGATHLSEGIRYSAPGIREGQARTT